MSSRKVKLVDQIRQAAIASGLSQNALARAAGMDPGAVNRFINGERGLSMEGLDALADVLGLRIVADEPKRKDR